MRLRAAAELERRRRAGKADPKFRAFQRTYADDPAALVIDCVRFDGDAPAPYQVEVLERIPTEKRVAVRSPHGAGKTAIAAWLTLWAVLTADDMKAPTTASAWRQLTKYLWPEIHKWAARLRWDKIGRAPFVRDELLTLSLKREDTDCEAFAVASNNAALIEGAHAAKVVYVFDEAKTIPEATWDAAEGAFASGDCYALAISTPGEPAGRFYDIHSRKAGYEDWRVRHVTLDEAIRAGRISEGWAEQRKRQWGVKSAVYQNRVLGEFAASEEDSVIPLAWVERAQERWREWAEAGKPLDRGLSTVGVDVARSGRDMTVLALRYGDIVAELRRYSKEDTMATTGRVAGVLQQHGGKPVVDVVGVGAGVVDRLREQGHEVLAFNAGAKTDALDRSGELGFADLRSAAWWWTREMLEDADVVLPPDDADPASESNLTGDLTAPKWRVVSGGKIKVESKDDIKKRLRRSTDDGDAVVMALTGDQLCEQEQEVTIGMVELPW